ncbi:MAG: hypothetical protein JRI95_14330 [Deltaproteobacteria bacterium]|nr:hypothetical protein [Deltaproteobacteria bacterium]
MSLIKEKSSPSRGFKAAGGVLLCLLAVVFMWLGFSSFLVGLAYSLQKGFWVACLAGAGLTCGGGWLLVWSVRKVARNSSRESREEGYLT